MERVDKFEAKLETAVSFYKNGWKRALSSRLTSSEIWQSRFRSAGREQEAAAVEKVGRNPAAMMAPHHVLIVLIRRGWRTLRTWVLWRNNWETCVRAFRRGQETPRRALRTLTRAGRRLFLDFLLLTLSVTCPARFRLLPESNGAVEAAGESHAAVGGQRDGGHGRAVAGEPA
jgi:hypothetical protein